MCTALQQHFTQIERLNDERISRNQLTHWSKKYVRLSVRRFSKNARSFEAFFSYIVEFQLKFLSNLLGSADNSAKFASRPSVQYSMAVNGPTGLHKTQKPLAALRWRILCSVSPECIINIATADQNQFSSTSRVCVPPNWMSLVTFLLTASARICMTVRFLP